MVYILHSFVITHVLTFIFWLLLSTGDNLDLYVKASIMTSEKRNKDMHLFTSNVIFPRIATIDMCNDVPKVDTKTLTADKVLLAESCPQRNRLIYAYQILLGRTLCKIPAFGQFRNLFPDHIPHEYSRKMSAVSKVFPLPVMFKNEAKHEDCLAIMGMYESELVQLYTKAFGN